MRQRGEKNPWKFVESMSSVFDLIYNQTPQSSQRAQRVAAFFFANFASFAVSSSYAIKMITIKIYESLSK
jgi:hypothetical protein